MSECSEKGEKDGKEHAKYDRSSLHVLANKMLSLKKAISSVRGPDCQWVISATRALLKSR
jgi:hypothetical protein